MRGLAALLAAGLLAGTSALADGFCDVIVRVTRDAGNGFANVPRCYMFIDQKVH